MELLQTGKAGKGKASHSHFAYFDPARGGLTSVSKDHSHSLSIEPFQAEVQDPVTGVVLYPGSAGGPRIDPAGKDGHTHTLAQLEFTDPEVKKTDEELVIENLELYKIAETDENEMFLKAEKSEEFYEGKQWPDADRTKLEGEGRACLTLNEIESKIDLLSGYQRQNRSDFKFMPVEGGDARVADALNILVKNVVDQNDFEFAETDVFEDGAITGRGNIHSYIDYSENIDGDIKLEHYPWRDVKYGPHNKKDGSDCDFLIKTKWYSKAYLEALFPDVKGKLKTDPLAFQQGPVSEDSKATANYGLNGGNLPTYPLSSASLVNLLRNEFRLIERESKEYRVVQVVVNERDDFLISGLTRSQVNQILTIPGMTSVDQVVTKIRRVTTAGTVLLRDSYLEDGDFSLIPFYAKKRGKKFWGKVEGVKDLNLEINKRHSQSIDIVNKMAAYGWFYDSDTFASKEDEKKFESEAARPGFKVKVSDINRIPIQTQGVKFPTEIAEMMGLESSKVKEIMNINVEMNGQARASQSGLAIQEQKRQGLIGNEFLFDNLNLSKKRLGRKIVRMMKVCYSPERVMRILNSKAAQGEVNLAEQPFGSFSQEELTALFEKDDLTKYDLVVSESPFTPTNRLANFMIWSDLAGKGAPIPVEMLVDMSDAPDKEKMKKAIQAETERQAQIGRDKNQTEIMKTQIAHQNKPGINTGMQ